MNIGKTLSTYLIFPPLAAFTLIAGQHGDGVSAGGQCSTLADANEVRAGCIYSNLLSTEPFRQANTIYLAYLAEDWSLI
ncbi:MAG: hypothetical protein Q7J20_12490 [Candidatus Nitrotoga sp.]|nr:hypothetical protein [Candidatus Nitrotoga sp.]MDO9448684.1 hypothetical protein [Candidatus Nitrotoga sp.]MDP3497801.1 hypothetical protein [Candidatus Nitrotoga sp.]